jgi:hypothetical protein
MQWRALWDGGYAGDGGALGSRPHVLCEVETLTYGNKSYVSFLIHEHVVALRYEQDKPRP